MNKYSYFINLTKNAILGKKIDRTVEIVSDEYTAGWISFREKLEKSKTIEEWLNDNDDVERYYNIDGELKKQVFDSSGFYRKILLDALEENYPEAKTVAEFGSGVGRNLIYLHQQHPELKFYGFELCKPGVELANAAAEKFNLPIQYFQLDYLNWMPSDINMPDIDVAFTNFSLEQIPKENLKALNNIMSKVNIGTFHLEPVVENYPWTIKGIISKLDHNKAGYLKNFDKNARKAVGENNVFRKIFNSAHNPLMFPSLYVLKKN